MSHRIRHIHKSYYVSRHRVVVCVQRRLAKSRWKEIYKIKNFGIFTFCSLSLLPSIRRERHIRSPQHANVAVEMALVTRA